MKKFDINVVDGEIRATFYGTNDGPAIAEGDAVRWGLLLSTEEVGGLIGELTAASAIVVIERLLKRKTEAGNGKSESERIHSDSVRPDGEDDAGVGGGGRVPAS